MDGEPIDFSTYVRWRGIRRAGPTTRAPSSRLQRCSGARRNSTCGCPAATRFAPRGQRASSPRAAPPPCPGNSDRTRNRVAPPTWTRRIPSSVFCESVPGEERREHHLSLQRPPRSKHSRGLSRAPRSPSTTTCKGHDDPLAGTQGHPDPRVGARAASRSNAVLPAVGLAPTCGGAACNEVACSPCCQRHSSTRKAACSGQIRPDGHRINPIVSLSLRQQCEIDGATCGARQDMHPGLLDARPGDEVDKVDGSPSLVHAYVRDRHIVAHTTRWGLRRQ